MFMEVEACALCIGLIRRGKRGATWDESGEWRLKAADARSYEAEWERVLMLIDKWILHILPPEGSLSCSLKVNRSYTAL
jgi:hypothetical protein